MEEAICGDFGLIKAWKADKKGNLIFRYVLSCLKNIHLESVYIIPHDRCLRVASYIVKGLPNLTGFQYVRVIPFIKY
jgi:hypothetical protein